VVDRDPSGDELVERRLVGGQYVQRPLDELELCVGPRGEHELEHRLEHELGWTGDEERARRNEPATRT